MVTMFWNSIEYLGGQSAPSKDGLGRNFRAEIHRGQNIPSAIMRGCYMTSLVLLPGAERSKSVVTDHQQRPELMDRSIRLARLR